MCVSVRFESNRIVAHACSFSRIPRIRTRVKARSDSRCARPAVALAGGFRGAANGVFSPFLFFFFARFRFFRGEAPLFLVEVDGRVAA